MYGARDLLINIFLNGGVLNDDIMTPLIIIILAIIVASLVVAFLWKILKLVIKVALIAFIAFALIGVFTGLFNSDNGILSNNDNNNSMNSLNSTGEITSQVTGFVSKSLEKAKLNAKKAIAQNILDDTKKDLAKLEDE